ncbi:hypothetical protein Tco_1128212 [Tanacetum coccineum]
MEFGFKGYDDIDLTVAYKLELPQQLSRVHNTFHVSNLKKCLSDESLVIPLEELRVDDKLHFVEEPVEVMDREIKQLKRSRIPIIKVRWNSKRGPEFTWEREDQFKQKYPHLFTKTAPSRESKGQGTVGFESLKDFAQIWFLDIGARVSVVKFEALSAAFFNTANRQLDTPYFGYLATALGEIQALQAREQARADVPEGTGSSS